MLLDTLNSHLLLYGYLLSCIVFNECFVWFLFKLHLTSHLAVVVFFLLFLTMTIMFLLPPFCLSVCCLSPGGDGGERGAVRRHGPGAGPEENLEPGGEAVLIGPRKADGDRLLHVCAGLAGRHDA